MNTLRAGFIDTPFRDFLTEAQAAEMCQKVRAKFPVRRVGTPADVGHAAVFLMTNPYVTQAASFSSTGSSNCPAAAGTPDRRRRRLFRHLD